jgi:hypothetical protein
VLCSDKCPSWACATLSDSPRVTAWLATECRPYREVAEYLTAIGRLPYLPKDPRTDENGKRRSTTFADRYAASVALKLSATDGVRR